MIKITRKNPPSQTGIKNDVTPALDIARRIQVVGPNFLLLPPPLHVPSPSLRTVPDATPFSGSPPVTLCHIQQAHLAHPLPLHRLRDPLPTSLFLTLAPSLVSSLSLSFFLCDFLFPICMSSLLSQCPLPFLPPFISISLPCLLRLPLRPFFISSCHIVISSSLSVIRLCIYSRLAPRYLFISLPSHIYPSSLLPSPPSSLLLPPTDCLGDSITCKLISSCICSL